MKLILSNLNTLAIALMYSGLNMFIPSTAWAQDKMTETTVWCFEYSETAKRWTMTDPFTVTAPVRNEQEFQNSITQKFNDTLGPNGSGRCQFYPPERASGAASDRKSTIDQIAGRTPIIELRGWHPNNTSAANPNRRAGSIPATTSQSSASTAKRESLIVRSLGDAPAKPVAKPPVKAVVAAKSVAKPIPKKKSSCRISGKTKICGAYAR